MSTIGKIAGKSPVARPPQRKRGEQRVAALLAAAAGVFADKGYATATMTEIAARAGAPIGSLYQFFPNKELLGAALMQRYLDLSVEALQHIEATLPSLSPAALASALLDVFVDLKTERAVALALFDSLTPKDDARGAQFRAAMTLHLGRILKAKIRGLSAARADAMALAVLHQMKAAVALDETGGGKPAVAAQRELRAMLARYFEENFSAR